MKKKIPTSVEKLLKDIEFLINKKKFATASKILENLITKTNLNYKLYFYYACCLFELNQIKKSIIYFNKVEELQPDFFLAKLNHSLALQRLGKLEESIKLNNEVLLIVPNNHIAWFNKGTSNQQLGKLEESIKCFQEALRLNSKHLNTWFNLGVSHLKNRNYKKSLESFKKTVSLDENFAQAWIYMGITLLNLNNYTASISAYEKAEKLNAKIKILWKYKAQTYYKMMLYKKAMGCIQKFIKVSPNDIDGLLKYSSISKKLGNVPEAIKTYERIKKLNKNTSNILGLLMFEKLNIGDWNKFKQLLEEMSLTIKEGKEISAPLILNYLPLSSNLLKINAETYVKNKTFKIKELENLKINKQNYKIKIAYLSSDYRAHPIGMQMIEVLKYHNNQEFDITGFSLGPKTNDPINQKFKKLFKNFINIQEMSDLESIKLLRSYNFDIAIYLNGFTEFTRINLLKNRIAKIQINYLGHPGCMTKDLVDYTITDRIIVPESEKKFYSEKIVYLPNHYKICYKTVITQKLENKKKNYALPKNKFVFCCFNNSFKITPDLFKIWIRILKNVNGSILWLLDNSIPELQQNLKNILKKESLNPNRLIFASRLSHENHFKRLKLADLFLDTFYYSASATASDALWAGLPLITLKGKTFSSRVAASLLENLEMPELITNSKNEYENLAIELANNKNKLKDIKAKILTNIENSIPFNNKKYVLNLESLYKNILQDNK